METVVETSTQTLARINHDFAAGRTVHVGTCTRVTSWSPKTVAKFLAKGIEPFKVGADGCLRMYSGFSKGTARYVSLSLTSGALLVSIRSN